MFLWRLLLGTGLSLHGLYALEMHEEAWVLSFKIHSLWYADASICQAFDEPLLLSCNPGPGVVSPLPGGAMKHDAEMWQALLHFLGQVL